MRAALLSDVIKRSSEEALVALGFAGCSVEVGLVSDAKIRALNQAHRQKNKATDVLSFPLFAGKNGKLRLPKWALGGVLGSVVISRQHARAQARAVGHSYRAEIVRLVVHGVCHVVGYDHERSERDENLMFAEEDRILSLLKAQGFY